MNSWLSILLAAILGNALVIITQPEEYTAIFKGVAIAMAWILGYISKD